MLKKHYKTIIGIVILAAIIIGCCFFFIPEKEVQNNEEKNDISIKAEELLKSEDVVIKNDNTADFETIIRSLGFTEFYADYWRPTEDSPVAFEFKTLTYNKDAFKLEFNYVNYNDETQTSVMEDGWVMYGVKSDAPANISNYEKQDYDWADEITEDDWEYEKDNTENSFSKLQTFCG